MNTSWYFIIINQIINNITGSRVNGRVALVSLVGNIENQNCKRGQRRSIYLTNASSWTIQTQEVPNFLRTEGGEGVQGWSGATPVSRRGVAADQSLVDPASSL